MTIQVIKKEDTVIELNVPLKPYLVLISGEYYIVSRDYKDRDKIVCTCLTDGLTYDSEYTAENEINFIKIGVWKVIDADLVEKQ